MDTPELIVTIVAALSAIIVIVSMIVRSSATAASSIHDSVDAPPSPGLEAPGTRSGPRSPNAATMVLQVALVVLVVSVVVLAFLLLA